MPPLDIAYPTRPRRSSAPASAGPADEVAAEPDLAALPRRVDRRAAAEIVTRFFFPVSRRTVEAWPLETRLVNGRATLDTRDVLAFARAKLEAAPRIMGGRKPKKSSA